MPFKQVAVMFVKELLEVIQSNQRAIDRCKERNRNLDDDKLRRKFEHGTFEERMACGMLIKERHNKRDGDK